MQPSRIPQFGAVAAMLLAAAPVSAALLTPIDDCEVGAFSFQTNQGTEVQNSVSIPGHPSHAIASQRTVKIAASNQPGPFTFASLTPTPGDSFLSISIANFGYCDLEYTWGGTKDLTFGGTLQWIEMDVSAPRSTDQVTMSVSDGVSQTGFSQGFQFGGRETIVWGTGSLSSSVLQQATSIKFHFHPGQNGTDFQVYDIRFRTTGSIPVTFTGTTVSAQTPPVPSAPLSFSMADLSMSAPVYVADVAIADAMTDAMTVPAADWTWAKTTGAGGEWAEMSYLWTEPGGVQNTDFQISVDASEMDGGYVPEIYPPDPIHDPSSILLHFPVALRTGAGGTVQAVSDTWLSLDIADGQGLEFQNVSVAASPVTMSWSSGFTLSFRMQLVGGGTVDDQKSLFTASWISDYSTQVTTAALPLTAPGAAGALQLTAAPSVTRGGTELRASRPFSRHAAVLIHDVTGRTVSRVEAAPGATSVRWDGSARNGQPTAAGVYFARVEGVPGEAIRIVRLR